MTYAAEKQEQKITLGQSGNQLIILLAICLIFYLCLAFMRAMWLYRFPENVSTTYFYSDIYNQFSLAADGGRLLARPWTLFTFMFIHDDVWQVFANMLWLTAFGFMMQENGGNKKIIPVFIYSSLVAAILFLLAYNMIPALAAQKNIVYASGATAGVMGIAVATTLLYTRYKIFHMIGGGIPVWMIALIFATSALFTHIHNVAALLLLLGGAISGLLFVMIYQKGTDLSTGMNHLFDWFGNLFNPDKPAKGKQIKDELFYKTDRAPFSKKPNPTQERIDAILDKINKEGVTSLSEEEKELLKRTKNF